MDSLPSELVLSPQPLVFVTGEIDSHPSFQDDLIAQLVLHAKKDPKNEIPIAYQVVPYDYEYKEKSPPKDHPSSEGLLKRNWMLKHCSHIPSLVIFMTTFGTDWPAGEWIRKEASIIERINQLKYIMQQRDVKVLLVLVKIGSNTIDKDVIEERLNAMKRHCQLDGKCFVTLSPKDIVPGQKDSFKRLTKTVRDFSSSYYAAHGKKLRGMERLVRPSEYILLTRMNFKVAFFYEFQQHFSRALRAYRQCYSSLIDFIRVSKDKPEMVSQCKAVAEMVNFKICNIHLKNGDAKDAAQQFRYHMNVFSVFLSSNPWRDHAWAAKQFLVYVGLLTSYNVDSTHTDADRSYYYHRAALCSLKRLETYQVQRKTGCGDFEESYEKYNKILSDEPKYIGGCPVVMNNSTHSTGPSPTEAWKAAQYAFFLEEGNFDHNGEILSLLHKCLKAINPLYKRRKSHIRVLIAKQLMTIGDYDLASAHLSQAIEFMLREQWCFAAIPVLRKKMACAVYLGRPREYVPAALKLYKIAVHNFLEAEDRMQLHRDLMSVVQNSEKPSPEYLQELQDSGKDLSNVKLPLRPDYGAAAIDSHPPEYFLPDSYTIELGDLTGGLFDIEVTYDQEKVEVGHSVQTVISVTSRFQDNLRFDKMLAYFTDDVMVQSFIHSGNAPQHDGPSASPTSNTVYTELDFSPNTKRKFSFSMFIPESSLHKNDINHVCLERLVFMMSVELPTQTSGEEIALEDEASLLMMNNSDTIELEKSIQMELEAAGASDEYESGEMQTSSLSNQHLEATDYGEMASTEDINIQLQEESIDVVEPCSVQTSSNSESPTKHCESDVEASHSYDTSDDDDEDNECPNAELPPVESPHEKYDVKSSASEDDTDVLQDQEAHDDNTAEEDDDADEDDDDYNLANRLSQSNLGKVVPDLNKLDPLIPVVVDKDIKKSRSRSSSLTPAYAAEVLQNESNEKLRLNDGTDQLVEQAHPRTYSLPPTLNSKLQTEQIRERGYREVFFNASALSKLFRESRAGSFGTPARVKDIADFLDAENAPKLLTISPPMSHLRLQAPAAEINILQGTIQRVNVVFHCGKHSVLKGRVFLSSNYNELRNTQDNNFFWYPDATSVPEVTSPSQCLSQSDLDKIRFHPLSNSSDKNQPLCPLVLPDMGEDCKFGFPVFIKSDVQGEITLTIRVEYVPSVYLNNSISKEFTVKVQVLKPLSMNFSISSLNDPHCGTEKRHGSSNVLRGDIVNMAASLDCVNSLDTDIEVIVMTVMTKNAAIESDSTNDTVEVPVFRLLSSDASDEPGGFDLLANGMAHLPCMQPSSQGSDQKSRKLPNNTVNSYVTSRENESKTVVLRKGEAYVGSADIECLRAQDSESELGPKYRDLLSEMNSNVNASLGDVIVNWRVNDDSFFGCVEGVPPIATDRAEAALRWLPRLDSSVSDVNGSPTAPLLDEVSHTRVCNMLFSVPKVQVVTAPFTVHIDSPTVGKLGEAFRVRLSIHNNTSVLERLTLVSELTSEFLMTGGTCQCLETAPNSDVTIDLILVPMISGQIPLPHVCVTCDRSKLKVLEFGTYTIPKHIFVKPNAVTLH